MALHQQVGGELGCNTSIGRQKQEWGRAGRTWRLLEWLPSMAVIWAAAPPSFDGCATEAGGTTLREKLLLKPVKLKALVLGCGLAAIGIVGTSAMANQWCKQDHTGDKTNSPTYCRGDGHMFSRSSSCKCPNPGSSKDPNQEFTRKCSQVDTWDQVVWTCEKP